MVESTDISIEEEAARLWRALRALAKSVTAEDLRACIDPGLDELLARQCSQSGSDESTLWAADREAQQLVPIQHSGPDPAEFLERVSQPLGSGLISMVFAGGASLCENDIAGNPSHSQAVDRITGRSTAAMIVTPIHVAGKVVAVLSGVKICPDGEELSSEYSVANLSNLQSAGRLVGELIGHRLLVQMCGWNYA